MQPKRFLKKLILSIVLVSCSGFILLFTIITVVVAQDEMQKIAYMQSQTGGSGAAGTGGMDIVAVAQQEYANREENRGGYKYKNWYGMNADWCAMFVSWCADQCGYIEQGIIPKTASVYGFYSHYKNIGRFHYKEEAYNPKPGDIIIYGTSTHTGLVVGYDAETDIVTTIEGNTGQSSTTPFHLGSEVNQRNYAKSNPRITGFCSPEYPAGNTGAGPMGEGERIVVPSGLGSVHTYMGWQMITSPTSLQYKLRQEAGMNFDAEGFGRIGDRYVIACTTTFGGIGDYVDFYKENGQVLKCIIGDIKNQHDPGCNQWGHLNGTCIIEFVVDKSTWYSRHPNPGTTSCHPEWRSNITMAVNRGNFWG